MQIELILTLGQKEHADDPNICKELSEIQEYLNSSFDEYDPGNIYFLPIRSFYNHHKKTVLLVGVFASTLAEEICSLSGELSAIYKGNKAGRSVLEFSFPQVFLGILEPYQGFIMHLEFPIEGLTENQEIPVNDFIYDLYECKYEILLDSNGHS